MLGLNVTGRIFELLPHDASVIPANTNFLVKAGATATNNENFIVPVGVKANVEFWDAQQQVWKDVDPGWDVVDVKAVLPGQTILLGGDKTMQGLPPGSYRVVANLEAWIYIDGEVKVLTPFDFRIHYFTIAL